MSKIQFPKPPTTSVVIVVMCIHGIPRVIDTSLWMLSLRVHGSPLNCGKTPTAVVKQTNIKVVFFDSFVTIYKKNSGRIFRSLLRNKTNNLKIRSAPIP